MRIRTSRHFPALTVTVSILCLSPVGGDARADAPLIYGDEPTQAASRNKQYLAVPGTAEKTTVVFRVSGKSRVEMWRMPGWYETSYLSDDGDYLTVGYYQSLLALSDNRPDFPMLRFYRRGSLVRTVPLRELISDLKHLRRTRSHYEWGQTIGYIDLHRFAVDTIERRRLVYDVTNGQLISNTEHQNPMLEPVPPRPPRRR